MSVDAQYFKLTKLGLKRVKCLALDPGDILLRVGVEAGGESAQRLRRDHVVRDAERILLSLVRAGEETKLVPVHGAKVDTMLPAVIQTRTRDAGELARRVPEAGTDLRSERIKSRVLRLPVDRRRREVDGFCVVVRARVRAVPLRSAMR